MINTSFSLNEAIIRTYTVQAGNNRCVQEMENGALVSLRDDSS